ncbi:MAG: hypothetical protein AAGC54_05490 [Cyanobacteria bacterium P01_F01_bin.4]
MLTGIQAFEACWTAIKQAYPTSQRENTLLIQAMGQFVDQYATREEICQTLPTSLSTLFDRLVDAYLNGYTPGSNFQRVAKPARQRMSAATLAASQLRSQRGSSINDADTFIVDSPTFQADY